MQDRDPWILIDNTGVGEIKMDMLLKMRIPIHTWYEQCFKR